MNNRIVLHDYFERAEGGGRLSLTLAKGMETDLAYGFKAVGHPFFEPPFQGREHNLGCTNAIPLWRQFRLMKAYRHRCSFLSEYETAVYSGSYAPLAVLGGGARRNVLYCHTPPKFLYGESERFESMAPAGTRWLFRAFTGHLRPQYEEAARAMDTVIANSRTVQGRIKRDLGLEATVVHPPCDTDAFAWTGQDDFYLSFGRLDPLKRVDRIVEAFASMPKKKLVVASDGPQLEALRNRANTLDNVTVLGPVDETHLRDLVGRCIATIYVPRDEDFGMSPVESMAAGKPVVGVAEGGLLETVIPGETGLLIDPACTQESIAEAIRELDAKSAQGMREACRTRAKLFGVERFLTEMRTVLDGV